MQKTQIVTATRQLTEANFMGKKLHVHARKGDRGEVVEVFPDGGLMVRWARSGTACDALEGEDCEAVTA